MSSKEKLFEKYVSTGQSGFNHYSSIKWSPYFENVINKNILDKNSNILDIGCGTGSFLFHLKKLGFYNTYGIDISQEQINVAHNYGIQNTECITIEDFVLKNQTKFDIIILFDIIEHLDLDYLFKFIEILTNILSNTGKIIVHVPNGEGIFCNRILFGDLTHERAFTRSSLTQLFMFFNYNEISFVEDKPLVYGLKSLIRRIIYDLFTFPFRLFSLAEIGSTGVILSQNFCAVISKGIKHA